MNKDEEEDKKSKTFYTIAIEDLNAKTMKKIKGKNFPAKNLKIASQIKEVEKSDSDLSLEIEGKSFIAGEQFQVKVKGSRDNKQLHLLIKYTDEASKSYYVRYIAVEKDIVDVYAPGFFDGEYVMQLVNVESVENGVANVTVLDDVEFIVCPNPLLQDSDLNACKVRIFPAIFFKREFVTNFFSVKYAPIFFSRHFS